MTNALPAPPADLDPDHLAKLGAQFMSAKLLCVASELDLFAKLADGPLTLGQLAEATGLPLHSLRVVASGLVAIEILVLDGDRYENGPHAQAFLAGRSSVDLRPGLRLYNQLIYPMWMQFEATVKSGAPARHAAPSEQFSKIFSEGVEAWTGLGARALPAAVDLSGRRRVLDIGGGTGSYLVPLLARYPDLRGTLYDLPNALEVARRRLEGQPARDRISMEDGDVLFDPLPEGHDVVLMAGFIHLFDAEKVESILGRIRSVVQPGAKLLIVDQWMDSTRTKPAFGALLSCTYFLISGIGNTYTPDEARGWMERTGFRFESHGPLGGPTSLVVGEAI